MDEEKTIEEQVVEDTDADTRDEIEETESVEDTVDDNGAKLDDVMAAITDLGQRLDDAVDKLSSLFVKGGGIVNEGDAIAEAIAEETYDRLEDLDYTL